MKLIVKAFFKSKFTHFLQHHPSPNRPVNQFGNEDSSNPMFRILVVGLIFHLYFDYRLDV